MRAYFHFPPYNHSLLPCEDISAAVIAARYGASGNDR
jgi:hypothetical protein